MIEQIANVTFVSHLKNKSKDKIRKTNLTEAALAHIRNITSFDNVIYQQIKNDFPITMWSNFKGAAAAAPSSSEAAPKAAAEKE